MYSRLSSSTHIWIIDLVTSIFQPILSILYFLSDSGIPFRQFSIAPYAAAVCETPVVVGAEKAQPGLRQKPSSVVGRGVDIKQL